MENSSSHCWEIIQEGCSEPLFPDSVSGGGNRERWKLLRHNLSYFTLALFSNPRLWPILPHKEWFDVEYTPLRNLVPQHTGECWVLFAFTSGKFNSDAPLRCDGFMLPCQWRHRNENLTGHDPRLPQSLCELADQIKDQFRELKGRLKLRFNPDDFFLFLSEYAFDEKSELRPPILKSDEKQNVASAWGGLATGLYYVAVGRIPPELWPFSSIQYDFSSHTLASVEQIKSKLSVAADFNVSQFYVANRQQAEEAQQRIQELIRESQESIEAIHRKCEAPSTSEYAEKIEYLKAQERVLENRIQQYEKITPLSVTSLSGGDAAAVIQTMANGRKTSGKLKYVWLSVVSFILILCFLAGGYFGKQPQQQVFPVIEGQSGDSKENFAYTISGGEVTITGYLGSRSIITIPNYIEGYPVRILGAWAFNEVKAQSIKLPDTLYEIKAAFFHNCYNLTNIFIPASVTSIEDYQFAFCGNLRSIEVDACNPNYMSEDGVLFSKDKRILLEYPRGNERTEYSVPETVRTIPGAFKASTKLVRLYIPAGVTSIGAGQFACCSSLVSIDVAETNPNYVSIDGVLYNQEKTILVGYPVGNPRNHYDIPDGILEIIGGTFNQCVSLKTVTIPESVECIGGFAFGSAGVTSVTIPDKVTTIEASAFEGCSHLSSVVIGDNVTSICARAFYGCPRLSEIYIPDRVKHIDLYAFDLCNELRAIEVGDRNLDFCSVEGILFNKNKTILMRYPPQRKEAHYSIPEGVAFIWNRSFLGCNALNEITIPASVKDICEEAFKNCLQLDCVYFKGGAPRADKAIFQGCPDSLILFHPEEGSGWTNPWNGCSTEVWVEEGAPVIRREPVDKTVVEGYAATLKIAVTGTLPFTYQWYKNGVSIVGATNSTYSISSAKLSDTGDYTVTVSNEAGSVTSDVAILTVDVPTLELLLDFQFNEGEGLTSKSSVGNTVMNLGTEVVEDATQIQFSKSTPHKDIDPTITDDFSVYVDNNGVTDYARKYGYFKTENIHFGDTSDPSFSMEAWIKGLPKSSTKQVFFQIWSSPNGDVPRLAFGISTSFTVYMIMMNIADIDTLAPIPEDGGWHHIACVYNHPEGKIFTYVDGELSTTTDYSSGVNFATQGNEDWANTPNVDDSNCGMVGAEHSGYAPFTGYVDRLRLYKGVISPKELDYKYYGEAVLPVITKQP